MENLLEWEDFNSSKKTNESENNIEGLNEANRLKDRSKIYNTAYLDQSNHELKIQLDAPLMGFDYELEGIDKTDLRDEVFLKKSRELVEKLNDKLNSMLMKFEKESDKEIKDTLNSLKKLK